MDPDAVAAYLTGWWSEILAETAISTSLITAAVQAIYDADPTLAVGWANPLAEYFLLKRAVLSVAMDFDVTIEGDSYRLSQRLAQLQKYLDAAWAKVGWIVEPLADDSTGQFTVRTRFLTGDQISAGGAEWS